MLSWIKIIARWCRRLAKPAPHCGALDPHGGPRPTVLDQRFYGRTPHSGQDARKEIRYVAKLDPHGGLPPLQHPWPTLDVIGDTWSGSVAAVERKEHWQAGDLAREFHRFLHAQGLVGTAIHSAWICLSYPDFCRWLRVTWPPPYKDFARELALIMPRQRKDPRRGGKRLGTFTEYVVAPLERPAQRPVSDVAETLAREGRRG